jgi:hypothetical protein
MDKIILHIMSDEADTCLGSPYTISTLYKSGEIDILKGITLQSDVYLRDGVAYLVKLSYITKEGRVSWFENSSITLP